MKGDEPGGTDVGSEAVARPRAGLGPEALSGLHAHIVALLDVAVAALDPGGRAVVWNPAAVALFGVPVEVALGRSPAALGLARDPAPVEAAIARVLATGHAENLEGVAVDAPDGRPRHVRIRIAPLADAGGARGALILATDETEELKRVEQLARQKLAVESLNAALRRQAQALVERHRELEVKNDLVAAASRAKSEFIANMSHELRTPLNSIRGFCRLLLDARARVNEAEAREFLEIIDRNGEELLALIDDILELAKADSGRLQVQAEPVSVVELASDIADELKPLAREKGIALRVEVEPGVRPISTDPVKLQRIVRNLAANGVKFTHQGSVAIRIRPSELGGVGLDVVDSGIGVAAEDQKRIWDPFEQVDASNSRRYGGTGLGLSIVRRLAHLLGGSVSLASTPGVGSRFSIELPASPPDPLGLAPSRRIASLLATSPPPPPPPPSAPRPGPAVPAPAPALRAPAGPPTPPPPRGPDAPRTGSSREATGRRRRVSERLRVIPPDALAGREVLVVEDNEDSARLAQLLLEQRGCKVVLAPDAGQALALLQRRTPDAVVMDLMLPGLDGYEATRAIRSMPERANLPVVAATAAVLPGDKARALEAGCDDIVAKPYDADELAARIAAAIAERGRAAPAPRTGGGGP